MTKKTKIIIGIVSIVAGISAIAGSLYFLYKKNKLDTAIAILINANPSRKKEILEKMQKGYVIAWAQAVEGDKGVFEFEGKKYNSENGKAIG